MLVTAAWSAVRVKDPYLRAQFSAHQVTPRRKESHLAVAASMLTAVYFTLRNQKPYADLGPQYFDRHDKGKTIGRLVQATWTGCTLGLILLSLPSPAPPQPQHLAIQPGPALKSPGRC